ncbi:MULTISPECIES: heme exporter protein CcmD [Alteromonadaceae]|uniref:heme exporter protein CcmD n=1 Tax=Alteromonadaceae TaxID=72275 RepID=UPI001C08EF8E|nr:MULTISPECIES: heme exporter protein CcmD [Aliiglaciecola]MBU2879588.1 heme exporter protein CcmD [Aliiglaciecola lipolytica]MDO6710132.1 heme exporter protein CcmD [Aliiglaciecola sp. 2_MG-2023]MDO6751280.1 heme exporter protein CcmD [Aliiglaciecola sp. 1_MG-2023]
MNFQFDSWQAFWQMGGYGFYVWLAFGVSFLAVFLVVYESIWAKKQLIKAVNAQIARKKRIKQKKAADSAREEAQSTSEKKGELS